MPGDMVLFFLILGTLTIGLPGFWLRKDFINFITGLMTGPGTPWVESLEEQFIQVRGTEFVVCKDSVVFICCETALFLWASFQNTCNFILFIDFQKWILWRTCVG